ncbi:fucolectin-4 [Ctenopharyngodon idella]|uniref:fucolectin-4 n=1 Tax=Ctenopharyngodon idella TaxID=7959 RepID=UPI002230AB26|nr:fucolectin-4 [Ctenopharyngodon idella]
MTIPMITMVVLVLIFAEPCMGMAYRLTGNVALKSVTHQSIDLLNSNTASNAVDGNKATNLANNSCTYITAKRNPWWRVTLQQPYKIVMVAITNRGDCCADRIDGAEIRIGNSLDNDGNYNQLVAKVYSIQAGKTQKFKFSPLDGQYVNVLLPGENRILTVCEVEVYAVSEDMVAMIQSEGINVAPNGRATQSSVNQGSTACLSLAQNAIDGNRQYDLFKGSCTQTNTESDPWWRLDLIKTYTIASVALTNRGDCCAEQLNGAVVHIGDSLESEGRANPVCVKVSFIPAGGTGKFRCASALQGRYVTVALSGENRTLSLCEVEVFGVPTE